MSDRVLDPLFQEVPLETESITLSPGRSMRWGPNSVGAYVERLSDRR